ncbi:ComEA family DNA-binding protein [Streptomyces sp. NPDC050803]|uniref:ComEA family DNA-binding protein n=1 Tax=unclassified Streptomyces TaxID=2593676 RepID=UPI0034276775
MALRSRSRTATATSGPGRGPRSDVRTRHHRSAPRGRARHRYMQAEELHRRAQVLFGERAGEERESGKGPPQPAAGAAHPTAGGVEPADTDLVVEDRTDERPAFTPADRAMDSFAPADPANDWRGRAGLALRERMPLWMQTRCGLERRSVVALTVLLVAAAGLAVQHFWTGRTQDVRPPELVRAAPYPEGTQSQEAEPGVTAAAAGTAGAEIVVDVSGKVREPGIQRLPAGSRVADALRAAGGVRSGASTEGLNRARFLVDGEQVVVGAPAPAQVPAQSGTGVAGAAPAAPVSLNTATAEQLDTLPGVGPVLAQHIIDHRTRHGGFRSVDELREVNGIGDRRFADLRNLVRP